MSSRQGHASARVIASNSSADLRTRATIASVLGLLFGIAPAFITVAAVMLGPSLPYLVGALVSYALVAACVALALFTGIRGLVLVREAVTQLTPALRGFAGTAAALQPTDHGLRVLRVIAVAGIVLGGAHGLFLLGGLALTIPGIVWMMSIAH
jgi:hypothetical protein